MRTLLGGQGPGTICSLFVAARRIFTEEVNLPLAFQANSATHHWPPIAERQNVGAQAQPIEFLNKTEKPRLLRKSEILVSPWFSRRRLVPKNCIRRAKRRLHKPLAQAKACGYWQKSSAFR
jgi:hypothetical protein